MKFKISHIMLNGLVIFGIILTFIALLALPFITGAFLKSSEFATSNPYVFGFIVGFIYACALPYVIALFELKSICRLIFSKDAFSNKTASRFKAIAICSFSEAVIFLAIQFIIIFGFKIYMLALTAIPMFVVPFICIVFGLFFLAISGIFKKAAEIKAENDSIF